MTLVQSRAVSLSSPSLVKMEERKRPAAHERDDSAPPYKKQATSINGGSKPHVDADMPWKDELEVSFMITSTPLLHHPSLRSALQRYVPVITLKLTYLNSTAVSERGYLATDART